ncbi:MAG TPA: PH domain-containing protein, partial [Streptosporangiaceae bacterium]
MESEGPPGAIYGKSKRSFMKNRWSVNVAVDISSTTEGSMAVCRVEMAGTKHYEVLADIAEAMGDIFDDRGVPEAVERLGKASLIFRGQQIRHLRNLLYANERVLELGQGSYERKHGLVVLTNERLFFLEKSLGSETLKQFSLSSIVSLAVNKKRTGETLIVHAAGDKAEITRMAHGQADPIVRAFRNLKQTDQTMAAATSQVPSSDADPLAQIERLAALRDKGIISAEEFESKKTELMGRI